MSRITMRDLNLISFVVILIAVIWYEGRSVYNNTIKGRMSKKKKEDE